MKILLSTVVLFAVGTPPSLSPSQVGDGEWAENVPFTTDWDTAIKRCQSTGKLLLVYNGWERRNV